MKIYIVLSGYKPESPVIIQTFKTKRAAEKAATKRRAFWPCVSIKEIDEYQNIVDIAFPNIKSE